MGWNHSSSFPLLIDLSKSFQFFLLSRSLKRFNLSGYESKQRLLPAPHLHLYQKKQHSESFRSISWQHFTGTTFQVIAAVSFTEPFFFVLNLKVIKVVYHNSWFRLSRDLKGLTFLPALTRLVFSLGWLVVSEKLQNNLLVVAQQTDSHCSDFAAAHAH